MQFVGEAGAAGVLILVNAIMAGVGASHVSFDGRALRDLAARIGAAASRRRRRLLLEELAAAGESATRERFDAAGPGPDGVPWPPRRDATNPKPLLSGLGTLADSISTSASARTARWGSNRIYARIHQLGGTIRPRRRRALRFRIGRRMVFARHVTIPARPFIGWGDAEERLADGIVRSWVERALAEGGA